MPLKSSITRTADGLYELSLSGRLHRPHWVVQLFAALSQLHVSISSGYAAQEATGEWQSKFVLDFSRSSADPQQLDYASFSEQTASGDRVGTPRLARFELNRRTDQLLELKVEGQDQIGFSGRPILSRVSILSLFPSSLEIDTDKGQLRDAIVLRRYQWSRPQRRSLPCPGTDASYFSRSVTSGSFTANPPWGIHSATARASGEFLRKFAFLVAPLAISLANGPENAISVNAAFESQGLTKERTGWESNPTENGRVEP